VDDLGLSTGMTFCRQFYVRGAYEYNMACPVPTFEKGDLYD